MRAQLSKERSLGLVLFFVSGALGLVWQVTWMRALTAVLGSTVVSASIVAGVFVAALGLGARLVGPLADAWSASRCVAAYGACELVVAAWGGLSIVALPALGPALASAGGYDVDPRGWLTPSALSVLVRACLALATVGFPALAMGATLPLMSRALVGADAQRAGLWIGLLYGVSTLGAALGVLGAEVFVMPALGVRSTALVTAALGAVVALVATTASRAWPASTPISPPREEDELERVAHAEPRALARIALALFLGGVVALGFEILWLRFLGSALGGYRAVFAMILAVHLVGLWLGSFAGAWLSRASVDTRAALGACQISAASLALFGLATLGQGDVARSQAALLPILREASEASALRLVAAMQLGHVAWVVLPASIAMGAVFPLANALVREEGRVARHAGSLYLATSAGNLAGSLAIGLWLIGVLGLRTSALALSLLAVGAALSLTRRAPHVIAPVAGSLLALLFALRVSSAELALSAFPRARLEAEHLVSVREGVEHTLAVTGLREGPARLWTSGHPMSSTAPRAQRYMRLLAHLPLLGMARPERALVICFGVGNTAHAASLHPLVELDVVDLDRAILEHAPFFAHANHDVLRDPRTRVIVDDGRNWLLAGEGERYDLITLEPPPMAMAGVGALYSVDLYRLAHAHLREGGALSQWLPAYQIPEPLVRSAIAAFVAVFPDATLHVGEGRELLLVGHRDRAEPATLTSLAARLAERPRVAADLRSIGVDDAHDLALSFAAGPARLARIARGATPLRDDRPGLESLAAGYARETRLPESLLAPRDIAAWCADCARDPELREALEVSALLLASERITRHAPLSPPPPPVALDETQRSIAMRHAALRWLIGDAP